MTYKWGGGNAHPQNVISGGRGTSGVHCGDGSVRRCPTILLEPQVSNGLIVRLLFSDSGFKKSFTSWLFSDREQHSYVQR